MKKFAIILAIVALSMYASAAATGAKQGFSACSRPKGKCRSRRKAFMQCVPRKCLMGLGECMGKLQQKCWETEQVCMQTVNMQQCHDERHKCEQKQGGNQCDQEQQTCMQGKNTKQCDDGMTTCLQNAQSKGGKDCQSEMGHCVNQVPGYKACNGAMKKCYAQMAKATKPDWSKCSNDFQQCYNQLDQAQLGQCSQNLQNCERSSPAGACHEEHHRCYIDAGVSECDEAARSCHDGLNRDTCDVNYQQCAAKQGETKCRTQGDSCRDSVDTKACMTAAQGCASKKQGADKCLLSMMQMKMLEHNPPETIKQCMSTAGVTNNDPEHTGDACKLGLCVVPELAAPEAQCWLNCHFTQSCNCQGFKDPTSGCAAVDAGSSRNRSSFISDSQEDAFLSYFA